MSARPIQRTGCRILLLALLGLASSAAIAEAKVVWNDPLPLRVQGRDGFCRSGPLDRAERLAWRQTLMIRRPGYPFVPSVVTPFGMWVPFVQTGWVGFDLPLGISAPVCDR